MKKIAIIPARGGSKRIPKKNIKPFLGKPIIYYPIKTAIESNLFDEVMVSTDDEEVANISMAIGASVPFYRNKKTADDHSPIADVINEVLTKYLEIGKKFDYCCCILPTAVFVTHHKLQQTLTILINEQRDSVFPIIKYSYPIQRALKFNNSRIEMIWPENMNVRSQDLEPTYHDSGQFYWINVEKFLKTKKIFSDNSSAIVIPETEAQDIDTLDDWIIAEIKYKLFSENHKK